MTWPGLGLSGIWLLLVRGHKLVHALGDVLDLGTEIVAEFLLALLEESTLGLVVLLAVGEVLDFLAKLVADTVDGLLLEQGSVDDDAVPLLTLVLAEC